MPETSPIQGQSGRQPRRLLTRSGRGVRGGFTSHKSSDGRLIFESLIEADLLLLLEAAPSVSTVQSPRTVLKLQDGDGRSFFYTPDASVVWNGRPVHLEAKPPRANWSGHTEDRMHRVAAAMARDGLELRFYLDQECPADLLEGVYGFLHQRPLRGRRQPTTSQSHSNESRRILDECEAVLGRLMARDPRRVLEGAV